MNNSYQNRGIGTIGVILLGRKRPGFDQEWNKIMTVKSQENLEQLGFSAVGGQHSVVDDATTNEAIDQIKRAGCSTLLLLQPSIAHGQLAFTIMQRWSGPVLLWATPERPGDGKVSSCSLVGQHLWASIFAQAGHPFELVYGNPEDKSFHPELVQALYLVSAYKHLRKAKIGVVGTYVPGFVDLASDPFVQRQALGMQLHALSLPQYIERVQSIEANAVEHDVKKVLDLNLPAIHVSKSELSTNSRFYLAMKELFVEEKLDALAIQCWPEIPNLLGQWPYLAISRLSTEGYAVSMEGDVDGAIQMLMNLHLGLGPSFLTDWLEHDERTIFFWHPGMAPMNMCNPIRSTQGPTLDQHFNVAKPYVVNGAIRVNEPVTIVRLWKFRNGYRMTAFEGKTITSKRNLSGNTALVEVLDESVPQRFDRLLHAGMPHHVSLVFGHHAERYRRLCRLFSAEWCA